jgi:hypothetical protein
VRGPSSKSNTRQKGSQRSHRPHPVHIPHSNLHHPPRPHSPPKDPASPPYRTGACVKAHLCVLIDPFGHLTIDGRVAVPVKNTPYAAERRSSRRRFINTASGVPVFQEASIYSSTRFSHPSLISASVIEPTPNAAGCAHPSLPPIRVSHLSTQPARCVSVSPSFSWSTWECACDSHKGTTDRRSEAERTSFYFPSLFICFSVHSRVALRCLACLLARSLSYSVIRSSRPRLTQRRRQKAQKVPLLKKY